MSLLKANEKAFGDEIADINICINLLPDLSGGKYRNLGAAVMMAASNLDLRR